MKSSSRKNDDKKVLDTETTGWGQTSAQVLSPLSQAEQSTDK